jgi:hypothetical protein
MKITKLQLKRIIKEEKAKLLEMKNADRSLGLYADVAAVDALQRAFDDLLEGTEKSAYEDLEDDLDASEAAAEAVTLAIAHTFQAAGLLAQYHALMRTLK